MDKGPSGRACARYRRILLSLRLWGGDNAGGAQCPLGFPACVPLLPIEARHQNVVAATNPNQTCSTAPLRTWTLLCGVKITLPAPREPGVRAGACRGGASALHPISTAVIIPVEAEGCAGAHRAVTGCLCSLSPASSHQGSKPG